MKLAVSIALIVIVAIVQLVVWYLDRRPIPPRKVHGLDSDGPSIDEILAKYGVAEVAEPECGPWDSVHPDIRSILRRFRRVGPDGDERWIDRDYAKALYEHNPAFVPIGGGEDTPILAQLSPTDERIFIADLDEGDAENPEVYCTCIAAYLQQCIRVRQHERS